MITSHDRTLRLIFPQWQGGNNPPYHFGSKLLAWLAPEHVGPVEEVPVALPTDESLPVEGGVVAHGALLEQLHQARRLIDKHQPDRLVVLGGDCLVDLAPFAYLNKRYDGNLAVLWVDAHPDIMTPQQFQHAHAMVLGNLLGHGDASFVKFVPRPIEPKSVLYVGLNNPSEWEAATMKRLNLGNVTPHELTQHGNQPVLDWFKSTGANRLAIHLDLDVLDPSLFRALLFAKPNIPANTFDGIAQGQLTMEQIVQLLGDIATIADVVGLGIAEHLPWDALALKNMLARLPLIGMSTKA